MHMKIIKPFINSLKSSPSVFLMTLLGVIISITLFFIVRTWEWNKIQSEFERAVDARVTSLMRELSVHIDTLESLGVLFKTFRNLVTRDKFNTFATAELINHPNVQAFEWIPRVPATERLKYEETARSEGLRDFQISEQIRQGEMIPAKQRNEYFPVYYVEPIKGNEAAVGFDLASNMTHLTTLKESRDSGKTLATARIKLVQEKGTQFGFLIFTPVYNGIPKTVAERQNNLQGFALGVLRIGDIFETAIRYASRESAGIDLWLYDESAGDPLHHHKSRADGRTDDRFKYKKSIEVAGRKWLIVGKPTTAFTSSRKNWQSFAVLVTGLLATILLASWIRDRLSELEENREENRAILETVASGIITIDSRGTVQDFNPAAERIFGYSSDEIAGCNVNILMPEPHRSKHDKYVQTYMGTEIKKMMSHEHEILGKHKNGSTFPLDLAVNEMCIGNKQMFVGVLTDITARKEAEESLIAAKEAAEEANRIKSEFISIISHELRTPLTVILGNAPLLTDPDDMPDPEEIAEIAQDMEEDGQHLLTLINGLLDISKIEAGNMQLNIEILSAKLLVEEAVETIKPLAEKKSVTIEIQAKDMTIHADPIRMKQILLNLLGNAVKFTDEGSITVRMFEDDNVALFEIQDTGCGMEKDDLPFIFDVFRQVDSSSTRKASGTGLGLPITKRLIKMHEGEIFVKSKLNKGSSFIFTIPLYAASVKP